MRNRARAACAATAVLALETFGCSSATWLAGGPAARYVRHEPRRVGGEVLGRAVLGSSEGGSFGGIEANARVLATSREQLLGFGLGPAYFRSFGRGLFTLDGTPMLAFEHVPGSLLTVGTLRGGIGFGYAFEHSSGQYSMSPWPDPSFTHLYTRSTAFTLELTGSIDAPVTRAVEYSWAVLIGIAWIHQEEMVLGHPDATPFRFPLRRTTPLTPGVLR